MPILEAVAEGIVPAVATVLEETPLEAGHPLRVKIGPAGAEDETAQGVVAERPRLVADPPTSGDGCHGPAILSLRQDRLVAPGPLVAAALLDDEAEVDAASPHNVLDRMRGEAHVQRGTERRYYRCPMLGCRARRCPADLVEEAVLGTISDAVLPEAVIDTARTELRRRLQTPDVVVSGRQRARLLTRLENLRKQHGWGDLSDADYLKQRDAVRATLAALPDDDRIRVFDAYRARLLALPDAIAAASPARREELCRIVVERIVVRDRQLDAIEWTPPARPFFEKRQRVCPQGDSNP